MRLSRLAVLPLLPPPPTKERGVEKKARRCSLHFALAYQSRGVLRRASLLCFGFSTSFAKPLPASVNRVINERTLASPCRCRFPLFLRTPTQRRWQRRDVVGEFADEIIHLRFHWMMRVGPTISPVKTKVNPTPELRASAFDKIICQLNTRHVAEEDVLSHVSEYHSWR